MERIKPTSKKLLKCLIALLVVCSVLHFVIRVEFGGISEYISGLGIVYTPKKPANRFYYELFSIDTFEYWVFKLDKKESAKVLEDINNGNWSEMSSEHIDKPEYFEHYKKIFGNSYKNHRCYICIYDEGWHNIITDSNEDIKYTANLIIFLYDTDTNRYYCVYETK